MKRSSSATRAISLLAASLFWATACASGSDGYQDLAFALGKERAMEQVLELEVKVRDAMVRGDAAALEELFANDLAHTHSTGVPDTKGGRLDGVRGQTYEYVGIDRSDVKARAFGQVVVVTGQSDAQVNYQGKLHTISLRTIGVWTKRDGRWELVVSQATPITQGQSK